MSNRKFKSSDDYQNADSTYVKLHEVGQVEGYLVRKNAPKGDNSASYVLRTDEGEDIFFFAPTALPYRMQDIGVEDQDGNVVRGAYVKIKYDGMSTPKSGGRPYHNFKAFAEVDDNGKLVVHQLPALISPNEDYENREDVKAEEKTYTKEVRHHANEAAGETFNDDEELPF